jgi:zinc finger protein 830
MSDVRALLKAKRQEARVNHPLASYSASGQLRCMACSTVVKHASSWEGHVGSKAHRQNAARLREEEQRRAIQAEEEAVQGKRKADDSEPEPDLPQLETKKRRLRDDETAEPKVPIQHSAVSSGFPADFFSDPSQAPPPPESDEEEDEGGTAAPIPASAAPTTAAAPNAIDLEWEQFQQTVLNPPDQEETYERATVVAEPVLVESVPEGFPPLEGDQPEAAPEEELTEEQKRQQKEQEERELIMDRLLEEERAQEEADAKVVILKNRLEALRKAREAKKAAKGKSK